MAEIPKARDTRLLETCDGREAVDDTEQEKKKREAIGMVRMCCTKKVSSLLHTNYSNSPAPGLSCAFHIR